MSTSWNLEQHQVTPRHGANGSDKGAHAGVDLLPWWLNEVYWEDKRDKTRSVDALDVHAYPDSLDTSTWTTAQRYIIVRAHFDRVPEGDGVVDNWSGASLAVFAL